MKADDKYCFSNFGFEEALKYEKLKRVVGLVQSSVEDEEEDRTEGQEPRDFNEVKDVQKELPASIENDKQTLLLQGFFLSSVSELNRVQPW
ncbi:hypothetical protein H6P81_008665 [Aristolochia fimbriata]|uniref:Uncharacterized protein n=1 Tax=Aristolochia fimbriata TaxID=158543 RepID=A0AAV7EIN8_ARIFI|nr:hypothetical protein H6P81_008665 [Aristolochia fimbriata]